MKLPVTNQPAIKPAAAPRKPAGRDYWQSFEHLAESPEVAASIEREFARYDPEVMRSLPRRKFLKYAAASMMLAGVGLAGCRRWPKEVIAPYAHNPTDREPGIPEHYATSWELGGVGSGLLVASFDGRPIKIEGNPQHPGNVVASGRWGSADAYAQAQTLSLYDPDRSKYVVDRSGSAPVPHDVAWFKTTVLPRLRDARRLAVLSEATSSPTVNRLKDELGADWYTWEPLGAAEMSVATRAAFGADLRSIYSLDQALVVVSLDDDYLGQHPAHTRYAADWATLRGAGADRVNPRMSKCYTAETRYSITGASGDVRLPTRPSRLDRLTRALATALGVPGAEGPELDRREAAFVEAAARDLIEAGPNALVAAGPHLPADLQRLAMAMNDRIGAVGMTIEFIENPAPAGGTIAELAAGIAAGEVDALVILGGNPAYDAPADLGFAALLEGVPLSVHLSHYDDETSRLSTVHVPRAHFLEHWGDTRGWDGTIAPIQPLILPIYGGLSPIEMLALLGGNDEPDGNLLVRETMAGLGVEGDLGFRTFLHDGVLPGSAATAVAVTPPNVADVDARPELPAGDGFDVVFCADGSLYDGRFANNGWLQECPDPLTKLTWDNAALFNYTDAERLGIETNDVVTIALGGRSIEIAVYVMPGQPAGSITLPLGYGRTAGGALATVDSAGETGGGFDTYRLRTRGGLFYASGAVVAGQGQRYVLAMTQNHHLIDATGYGGREKRVGEVGESGLIVRECTYDAHADYMATYVPHDEPPSDRHNTHPANKDDHGGVSLQVFQPPGEYNYPHAWGMTIDMTACMGCSACVVACQSENNIPVVGKESVLNNREMHWLRVDRYFKSEGADLDEKFRDDNPDVAWQPMMCVHCENAPCEQVCPVAATVHDTEGLNTMVYNRCIGTRYCSNNCPYKVRRFNYLDWHYKDPRGSTFSATYPGIPDQQQTEIDAVKAMVHNPDVTVRMRGVMEKCTYCTQRIQLKTIYRSKGRGEEVRDYDIKTACQQACPTEAIIFGDLNDPDARVTRGHKNPRAYGVLGELNTRPRTRYLARLRHRADRGEVGEEAVEAAMEEVIEGAADH